MKTDLCDIEYTDDKAVKYVAKRLSDEKSAQAMAETFKVLSDPTRMHIVEALSIRELCVCDIAALLNLSQSATSHQLRILRQTGVVRWRKDGKIRYYRLDDPCVADLFQTISTHVGHVKGVKE